MSYSQDLKKPAVRARIPLARHAVHGLFSQIDLLFDTESGIHSRDHLPHYHGDG